ncbi:MAG: J domain-containing protein, partial [Chloroflexus sp.]
MIAMSEHIAWYHFHGTINTCAKTAFICRRINWRHAIMPGAKGGCVNDDFEQLDDYTILGIRPGASSAEIKQAYLKQISLYHPDRYAGASPA